eukprot:scaffold2941_cov146-Skeletonema_marinoi.AAC.1
MTDSTKEEAIAFLEEMLLLCSYQIWSDEDFVCRQDLLRDFVLHFYHFICALNMMDYLSVRLDRILAPSCRFVDENVDPLLGKAT